MHTFLMSVGCFTSAKIVKTSEYIVKGDTTARAASHSLRLSLHAAMRMLMVVKHAGCNDCFKVITF